MGMTRALGRSALMVAAFLSPALAQNAAFHNAPASASEMKNPLAGQADAARAGRSAFSATCASCHGDRAQGTGNIPSLADGPTQSASDGEVFWYITRGDLNNGMPSWASLPEQERWQIVAYVKTLKNGGGAAAAAKNDDEEHIAPENAPPPTKPFTDYRYEKPGLTRKITVADLPAPFATPSAGNGPQLAPRPEGAWPKVPDGFKVTQYAAGLDKPRLIRTAPNGDFFVAESEAGDIKVFRGISGEGKPEQVSTFASGLKRPFGINFYPPGPNPQWVYVGNTDSVVRFAYQNGDVIARGEAQRVTDLPSGQHGHWTRDVQFTQDGKKMLVSVGSASNVDDPDTTPGEKNRADVLEFNPDGSGQQVYAYGIRNCVGEAINPKTGDLWCSVNERDGLGDNLVPDYITSVKPGGFYGWPWWYMGGHQDRGIMERTPSCRIKSLRRM
jgi:glucose/arabinose dehydrogenase/cytochrome c5